MEKKAAVDTANTVGETGTMNVGNWEEGGEAIANAMGPTLKKMFDAMQALEKANVATNGPSAQGGGSANTVSNRSNRGRKKLSDREERRRCSILEQWERARSAGVTRTQFCNDSEISEKDLEKWQSWKIQRNKRQQ